MTLVRFFAEKYGWTVDDVRRMRLEDARFLQASYEDEAKRQQAHEALARQLREEQGKWPQRSR